MKNRKNSILLTLILSAGTAFIGCGGGSSSDIEIFSFTSPSSATVGIGEFTAIDVDAVDPDNNGITYTISGTDADKFTIDSATGIISFKTEASPGVYKLKVTAKAGKKSISQNLTLTVAIPQNHAPVIKNADTVKVNENQYDAIDIKATDRDNDPITYSITGGSDADSFLVDSKSGIVVFKTPPVFERKDKYYIQVSASDGVDTTAKDITIEIQNVTDTTKPVITTMSSIAVDENQKYAVDIDAVDVNNETITYSIEAGGDAASFDIDPSTGVVTFKTAPDYETKKSYSLTVGATNSQGLTTKNITISINDLDGKSFVFKTGQTKKYADGDDGDYKAGQYRSFSINKNKTITEDKTKITWKNNGFLTASNYIDGVKYCNAISHGGYSDWRLPTIEELTDLANRGTSNYFGPFNIIKPDNYYWSQTSYNRKTNYHYTFGFDIGEDAFTSNDKTKYVACVRDESIAQTSPLEKRFTRYDDIVTDTKTKLQWYDPQNSTATDGNWTQALQGCNDLVADGHDDWRLPNINELLTIVDRSKKAQDAFYDIFKDKAANTYFSSTTNNDYTTKVWGANFILGTDVPTIKKTSVRYYRCVRTLGE